MVRNEDAETLKIKPARSVENETVLIKRKEILKLGDYVDFEVPNVKDLHIKITFNEIAETEIPDAALTSLTTKRLAARLSFTPTGFIYGGHSTKQTALNEYLVPIADSEHEEARSAYFFYLGKGKVRLFRVLVRHININNQEAELNIGYFRYTEPSSA